MFLALAENTLYFFASRSDAIPRTAIPLGDFEFISLATEFVSRLGVAATLSLPSPVAGVPLYPLLLTPGSSRRQPLLLAFDQVVTRNEWMQAFRSLEIDALPTVPSIRTRSEKMRIRWKEEAEGIADDEDYIRKYYGDEFFDRLCLRKAA